MSHYNTDAFYFQNILQTPHKQRCSKLCFRSQRSQFLNAGLDPDTPFTTSTLNRDKISEYSKPQLRKFSLSEEDQCILMKLHSTEKRRIYTRTHRKKLDSNLDTMESDINCLEREKEDLTKQKRSLEKEILYFKSHSYSGGLQ
eukprot:TRINITY_DN1811_c1_g1_i1.p1 TRINITY_DN1811_c1_g1~~TRINITY_DN1811_c1_g1_i1.p1  ORF type:complete len:143 (+),score=22.93 TRINITY_DN1811_c1_g1_i1:234-662(+)